MTTTQISIEARITNTTRFGCRHTESVRFFVRGLDRSDSYENGVAGCAYKSKRAALDAADAVETHRARRVSAA